MSDVASVIAGLSARERREWLDRMLREQKARAPKTAPLSFTQERLWFLDQFQPGSPVYNIPGNFPMPGPLNVPALGKSFNEIVRRHEVLRTAFKVVDWQPVQVVAPLLVIPLPVIDLRPLGDAERYAKLQELVAEEALRPFDLATGPLIRTSLVRLGDQDHMVLLTVHHIVCDGWSLSVLFRELGALYQAFASASPSPLRELRVQYADFARWQRDYLQGEALEAQLAYWRRQLAEVPPLLALPYDRPRPPAMTFRGAAQPVRLSPSLTAKLRQLNHREGVTMFMTLLAAFNALLYRYTGQTKIAIGTPVANRARVEFEEAIGCFLNMVVFCTEVSGEQTFEEQLRSVRDVALGAFAHQDLPFEKLVEALRPSRDPGYNPIFQVSFNLQTMQGPSGGAAGAPPSSPPEEADDLDDTRPSPGVTLGGARFDLTLSLVEYDDSVTGWLEYSTDLFDHATIARMAGHLNRILEGAADNPGATLSRLPLLTPAELRQRRRWNETDEVEQPSERIHDGLEAQAARTPEAIAVEFEGRTLTYRELDERAGKTARYLRALGVEIGAPVAICLNRSPEMLVAIYGVLKAGGAYVPLDPTYPRERLAFMLADCGADVLLSQQALLADLPPHAGRTVCLDADWGEIDRPGEHWQSPDISPDALAYIIYTSGSTGVPKGVLVAHRGVVNSSRTLVRYLDLGLGQRMLQFASLSFDVSVFEFVPALMSGMTLCLARKEALLPGPGLIRLLRDLRINVVTLPPSVLAVLPIADLPDLTTLQVAGEAFSADLVARWSGGRRFFNAYGPTEGSIWTAGAFLDGTRRPVIGRPIPNSQIHLLDQHLEPVPVGVTGELYIGGIGVTRGYLGRPEATAANFIPDPFSARAGARMYRTGDLARYLADGTIEYVGRADHQVKLRGFRIELGEIEAALARYPHISHAAVVLREERSGDRRLIAYLAARAGGEISTADLRRFLRETLPEHMIPANFVVVDAIPLTSNGKIDRAALPHPDAVRPELSQSFVAPQTPLQQVLARIWEDVLNIRGIGIADNFFELGGHSLLISRLVSRIRESFGVEIAMRRVFECPTIADLARGLAEDGVQGDALDKTAQALIEAAAVEADAARPSDHNWRVL
ncbi:MAG TPA: amino acid adenylation domain-containing protein [Stellaceae bacterium]|nr:amino acid adenylation domain-containing protein [Stellaceae bacterium]